MLQLNFALLIPNCRDLSIVYPSERAMGNCFGRLRARRRRCKKANVQQCLDQLSVPLPEDLFVELLIKYTDVHDKKALRLTSRAFCDILDMCMTDLVIRGPLCGRPRTSVRHIDDYLQRLQSSSRVRTLALADITLKLPLTNLPYTLTALQLDGKLGSLKPLAQLPCLKVLSISSLGEGCRSGRNKYQLPQLPSLTWLETSVDLGSVAHLAPTLRHLGTSCMDYVQGVEKLNNLEVLMVWGRLACGPLNRLQQLPLVHLEFWPQYWDAVEYRTGRAVWPPTLKSLSMRGDTPCFLPMHKVPNTVTSLYLYNTQPEAITSAVTNMPGLRKLGVSIHVPAVGAALALSPISQLKSLSHLTLHIDSTFRVGSYPYYHYDRTQWDYSKVMSELPVIAELAAQGTQVEVVGKESDMRPYDYDWPTVTKWAA